MHIGQSKTSLLTIEMNSQVERNSSRNRMSKLCYDILPPFENDPRLRLCAKTKEKTVILLRRLDFLLIQ
jgi:hypothetical protein